MAKQSNGKKKARVWYSKGNPSGNKSAKGLTYREESVGLVPSNKRAKGHVALIQ